MTLSYEEKAEALAELQNEIISECICIRAGKVGLDVRCGDLWIGTDFIYSETPRLLDYYGGFEYIDSDQCFPIGTGKMYSNESPRVQDVLEAFDNFEEAA